MGAKIQSSKVSASLAVVGAMEPGERQVLNNVAWNEYEQVLARLGDRSGIRLTYAEGALEFMAPLYRHEVFKDIILMAARILTKELGLRMQFAGATTFKRKDLLRGLEPDTCFYIQNAKRVVGKQTIDLSTDPPPDIAVEIDISSPSKRKIETYGLLGVPELWIYNGKRFRIFVKSDKGYSEQLASATFPFVGVKNFERLLNDSQTGHDEALDAFQEWVRAAKPGN